MKAVRMACRYVEAGIKTSPGLGKGSGPLNHFHSIQALPFAPSVGPHSMNAYKQLLTSVAVMASSSICLIGKMSSRRGTSTPTTSSSSVWETGRCR